MMSRKWVAGYIVIIAAMFFVPGAVKNGGENSVPNTDLTHGKTQYTLQMQKAAEFSRVLTQRQSGLMVGEHTQFERMYLDRQGQYLVFVFISPELSGNGALTLTREKLNTIEQEEKYWLFNQIKVNAHIRFLLQHRWRAELCLSTKEGVLLMDRVFGGHEIFPGSGTIIPRQSAGT